MRDQLLRNIYQFPLELSFQGTVSYPSSFCSYSAYSALKQDEMVGWHHQLNGHEFEQALGVGDGQGSLACCSPWGCKEVNTAE